MRESQIEQALVRRIKLLGGEIRKVAWIGRRGAPDRLVLLPFYVAVNIVPKYAAAAVLAWQHPFVELKAPGKKVEDHQAREHVRLRTAGFVVLVIDSPEGVDEWFPL